MAHSKEGENVVWVDKARKALTLLAIVNVPAVKRFTPNKKSLQEANVGYRNELFRVLFSGRLTEINVPISKIAVHQVGSIGCLNFLRPALVLYPNIKFAHFFHLIGLQSSGEEGILYTNGCINVAYIADTLAMTAFWRKSHNNWGVKALCCELMSPLRAGDRLLSLATR